MNRCLSNMRDIPVEGYSPSAARLLSGAQRKFPHRLPFNRTDVVDFRIREAEHMSISGIQDKISLRLERGRLLPTEKNGEYILKPVPSSDVPLFKNEVPANEHLTMQLAGQLFGIDTASNACIYFSDGELAYITKRFDRTADGTKIAQEDFCQLSNRTEETSGRNYKYNASYEETGAILRKYCKAQAVETVKLFRRIVFNYVFSNGDAHLKNFSLYRTEFGDHILTPAYDLICTSLHFPTEGRTALDLFDSYETESFKSNGFYKLPDFIKLAELFGIKQDDAVSFIESFNHRKSDVHNLIGRSFLSLEAQADYNKRFLDRLQAVAD